MLFKIHVFITVYFVNIMECPKLKCVCILGDISFLLKIILFYRLTVKYILYFNCRHLFIFNLIIMKCVGTAK